MRNMYDTLYLHFGNESAKTNAWLLEKKDYQARHQRQSRGSSSGLNGRLGQRALDVRYI
jgi:hypothetical protein